MRFAVAFRDKSRLPPKLLVWLGLLLLRLIIWFQTLLMPAPMRLADLAFGGFTLAEVLRTAAALGLADKMAHGPKTAQALAKEIGTALHLAPVGTSLTCTLCVQPLRHLGEE